MQMIFENLMKLMTYGLGKADLLIVERSQRPPKIRVEKRISLDRLTPSLVILIEKARIVIPRDSDNLGNRFCQNSRIIVCSFSTCSTSQIPLDRFCS